MKPSLHSASERPEIDVESIVRRVVRELQASHQPILGEEPARLERSDLFRFDQHVISLEDLKTIPVGAKRIQVPTSAVVTPSVQDELRHRGVELLRGDEGDRDSDQAGRNGGQPSADRGRSPFRRVHLIHDETMDTGLHAAVEKQVAARGIRLCDQAGVTVTISAQPAIAVYRSIAANTSAVLINRLDDVDRFKRELRPTVYVLDSYRLNLIAMVNAVVQIARRSEQPVWVRPTVTVAGGQR